MERHLLVGKEMNISDLAEQGRDVYLSTIRGKIKFSFVESGGGNSFYHSTVAVSVHGR